MPNAAPPLPSEVPVAASLTFQCLSATLPTSTFLHPCCSPPILEVERERGAVETSRQTEMDTPHLSSTCLLQVASFWLMIALERLRRLMLTKAFTVYSHECHSGQEPCASNLCPVVCRCIYNVYSLFST